MTDVTNIQTQTIDSLVCVSLDIHLWTGRRKLTPKDLLRVAPENLPPQDLASLGSKKVCDPSELAVFAKLKRRAERLLLEFGYRFLGGYGIPENKLDEIRGELSKLASEFDAWKSQFLASYDQAIEQWIARHQEWETIIRKAATPVERVAERLKFSFRIFRVAAVSGDKASDDDESLLKGSYHSIVREVSRASSEAWEKSFKGKAAVTQRALRPIRKMREKLNGLSFLDSRIFPLIEQIDEALDGCPVTGEVAGSALAGLNSVVLLLSDPERMIAHGEAMINGNSKAAPPEKDAEIAESDSGALSAEDLAVDETVEAPVMEPATPTHKRSKVSESGLFF